MIEPPRSQGTRSLHESGTAAKDKNAALDGSLYRNRTAKDPTYDSHKGVMLKPFLAEAQRAVVTFQRAFH